MQRAPCYVHTFIRSCFHAFMLHPTPFTPCFFTSSTYSSPPLRHAGAWLPGVTAVSMVLGRLASRLSVVFQGKDKPIYSPSINKGDECIMVNADKIAVTGDKLRQKTYRWHTG
ncbi:unnamed protein product [Closterium sp. NIES-54]